MAFREFESYTNRSLISKIGNGNRLRREFFILTDKLTRLVPLHLDSRYNAWLSRIMKSDTSFIIPKGAIRDSYLRLANLIGREVVLNVQDTWWEIANPTNFE